MVDGSRVAVVEMKSLALPVLLALTGCATTHSLTPVALATAPAIKTHAGAELKTSTYATFSVFPLSQVNLQARLKGAELEKPILFMLRNTMETLGYRFVDLNESPDLLVTLDASSESGQKKLPSKLVPPNLTPGSMIPQPQAVVSLLNDGSAAIGWGKWQPRSPELAPLPGYPPRRGTRKGTGPPPKITGYTFTALTVSIIDAKIFKEVWTGAGAGMSRTRDLRINSQLILWAVMHQFPPAALSELHTSPADVPGMQVELFTNDGKHYFPAITKIESNSPAWRSGAKRWDMILALDAETTANQPYTKFRSRLGGPANSSVSMTLWRRGEQVHVTVERHRHDSSPRNLNKPPAAGTTAQYLRIPRTTFLSSRALIPAFGIVILGTLVVFATIGT